jgi:tetratricopeptide (TPR) repeat protein
LTNTPPINPSPSLPPADRRVGRVLVVLLACAALGSAVWWYGPGNSANRYSRMSLLDLNHTLNRDPHDRAAARMLALRLARSGDAELAEPALRNSLLLSPNDPEVTTGLGELLMAKGSYPEAFQLLKSAAERFPHYGLGRSALGRLYMKKGSYLHASTEFEAVVEQDKSADDAWYQLAVCYLEMQQSAKAQAAIDAALHLQSNEPHYLALKGSVDVAVGNAGAGIDETKRASELAPQDVRINSTLVNLLLAQHRNDADLDLAEKSIGKLEQMNPDYPLLPYQRGELERLRQHWEPAAHYLERALQTTPQQDEVYFSLSQVYRRLNRIPDAERLMKLYTRRQDIHRKMDAVRIDLGAHTENAMLYAKLADLQMQMGDRPAAISSVKSGLVIDPKNALLQRWLRILDPSAKVGTTPPQ